MGNLIRTTTEFAMHIIRAYVQPGDIVIDATCGNGHDSLKLAAMRPGHLYAFDIQPDAVQRTRKLLREEAELAPDHFTCEVLSHAQMASYFREHAASSPEGLASAVVFNLGYLPGGDKTLTTRAETTLDAVRDALLLLRAGGLCCITMYSGHPEGAREKKALLAFAEGLDSHIWHVSYISMPNQKNAPPEILLITRKR